MLVLAWLLQVALMALCVSAFHPYYPVYKCIEDGKCSANGTKRDIESREIEADRSDIPSLKIRQRIPQVRGRQIYL